MTTTLQSDLFKNDAALQAAADRDSGHVVPETFGDHVAKIQAALLLLTTSTIDNKEFLSGRYGPSTAKAVLAYKEKREIINRSYQQQADNIVGKMTIAKLDEELGENELARLLCAADERSRIDALLRSLRPSALRMINTTVDSVLECKEVFELSIINPVESFRLRQKNALTLDGLKRFFSIDSDNQSAFLPRVTNNYRQYGKVFPRLPGDQRGIGFVEFLQKFRANLVRAGTKALVGGKLIENLPAAISSRRNGAMFFTPRYRLFDPAEPIGIRGPFAESLTGIQIHEMGHFYFDFDDGDPRGRGPEVGLRMTASYDIVARQATFKQRLVVN